MLKNCDSRLHQRSLTERRFLKTEEIKKLLGYRSTASLMQAARTEGIPFIRINQRRILWDEDAVTAWLDSSTIGKGL